MTDLIIQHQWEQHHCPQSKAFVYDNQITIYIYGQAKLPSAKFISFPNIRFLPLTGNV